MVQAWIGFTLSDMTRLHGNGVSQNGSYDYSKECPVATSAKGTMSRDAEQGTHESQFVFPCALFGTSCPERTLSDHLESLILALGVVKTTTRFGHVPLTAAETADFHGFCLRHFEGVTNCGLAASRVQRRSTPAWGACLPRNERTAWGAGEPHGGQKSACQMLEADCRDTSVECTVSGRDHTHDHTYEHEILCCVSAWQRSQATCETTMIQGETLLTDSLDVKSFAYFDEQTVAHFGYQLRYIVFVVECCRVETAVFNDVDRFLNNGTAKSCGLLVLMISRQSFSVTILGDIFLTPDVRVLEKGLVTEYPWCRPASGQMHGCILTAASTALPVETGSELQQDELRDNGQRTFMAIRWVVLRCCYDLLHAVDLLAAMLGQRLANDFVKHRLTKGIRSDGHLRMCYWMGDLPALILPQWNGEFEHGGNADMRSLSDCTQQTLDKLLSTTQLCYLSMVESTDQAIV